jgi:hypothetical protein
MVEPLVQGIESDSIQRGHLAWILTHCSQQGWGYWLATGDALE